jgi:multidrug efflux system outer membrane protein
MPEHWRFASDETSTVVNRRWWEQFHDPVLNELIQEALDNNKDLGLATARIAEFRARFGITRSQLFPQVSAQASLSRQRISETTANNFFPIDVNNGNYAGGNYNQAANLLSDIPFTPYFNDDLATFNVSYELDLWGKNRSATSAAFAELLSQVDAQRAVILSVVSSVALAYIRLRQYDRQLQISIQTLESRQKSLELANIRFQEGLTSELEVKQAASEREEAAIQMIQFQTLIPQQEDLLSVLIGHPPKAIQRGQSVDGWQLPPQVPAGLPADLLEQRPDIQQAEKQLIAANFRIGEARALYFPDITLTGYYGYESSELDRLFTDPSRTWQWMLSLLQPLFTGGRISNTVDLAQALKREAAYQYLQTTLTALQEVNDALVAHRDSKRSLLVDEERVRDLAEYLRLARLQYDNGLVDYLNVLDAERRLFNAELDLARDKANVFITLVNIYRALGGGWVVDAENLMQGECPFQEELKSTEKDS